VSPLLRLESSALTREGLDKTPSTILACLLPDEVKDWREGWGRMFCDWYDWEGVDDPAGALLLGVETLVVLFGRVPLLVTVWSSFGGVKARGER